MSLDKATVARIAQLARIRIDADRLEPMAAELGSILDFVEQLNAVDTADVPPMTGAVSMKMRRRGDVIADGNYPEKVLANAPEEQEGYYVVPKIVEQVEG